MGLKEFHCLNDTIIYEISSDNVRNAQITQIQPLNLIHKLNLLLAQRQKRKHNDMNVNMKGLRELMANTIAEDFKNEGFAFNKSKFEFRKKDSNGKIVCSFVFNHFYEREEFGFIFKFDIVEIHEELKKFWKYYGSEYTKDYCFLIREGDLHPQIRDELPKFRAAFVHKVYDLTPENESIADCRKVLKDEFFPMLETFSVFEKFQEFIFNNYIQVVDLILTWPALIAAKLHSEKELSR